MPSASQKSRISAGVAGLLSLLLLLIAGWVMVPQLFRF
jgi:hypothetical protein